MGTGFIVRKDTLLYLVSALHVFNDIDSVNGWPEYEKSMAQVDIYQSNNDNYFHREPLIEPKSKRMLYKFSTFEKNPLIDIAVLKLNNINKGVINDAISYSDIDTTLINNGSFGSYTANIEWNKSFFE